MSVNLLLLIYPPAPVPFIFDNYTFVFYVFDSVSVLYINFLVLFFIFHM